MKNTLLSIMSVLGLIAIVSVSHSTAQAAKLYGAAGCGLGNMALGSQPGSSQIFAATTNGSSGTQTFGITSGTSNCDESHRQARVMMYLDANKFALSKDVARGEGETLAGLAQVIGCDNTSEFKSTLRDHYQSIFPAQMPETQDLSSSIQNVLKADQAVARQCVASRT